LGAPSDLKVLIFGNGREKIKKRYKKKMAIGGTKGLKRTIVNGCGKGWGKEHCMARRRRLDVGVEQTDGKRHDEERTKVCGRVKKGNQ